MSLYIIETRNTILHYLLNAPFENNKPRKSFSVVQRRSAECAFSGVLGKLWRRDGGGAHIQENLSLCFFKQ